MSKKTTQGIARRPAAAPKRLESATTAGARRASTTESPVKAVLGAQQTVGNRETRDGLGSVFQPKLTIGAANDPLERQADRTADAVLGSEMPNVSIPDATADVRAQRMCAECAEEEEEELVQPKAFPGGPETRAPLDLQARLGHLRGRGKPLPPAARSFFEPRFDHDFSDVRVHTGPEAAATSRSIDARAFTVGRDIVFGRGQYDPDRHAGRHLLAHELTHVVQQTPLVARRKPIVQREMLGTAPPSTPGAVPESLVESLSDTAGRETASDTDTAAAARGLIVDDDTVGVRPGQMKKSDFLAEVRDAVCGSAEQAFAGTEHSAQGCPWIEATLRFYEGREAARVERDMAAYVPEAGNVTSARSYIPFIAARARQSVDTWVATGEVTGLPSGLPGTGLAGMLGSSLLSGLGGLFFKARPGGARGDAHPAAVQSQLGRGRPLPGSARARMESTFGHSFTNVEIHDDASAARLSDRYHARAFTVGAHVAFGAGEYHPGSPAGDALLAHELAHVVQQEGAHRAAAGSSALEADADRSALAVAGSLWTEGTPRGNLSAALPRLSSGLQIQRCTESKTVKTPTTVPTTGSQSSSPSASGTPKNMPAGTGMRYDRESPPLPAPGNISVKDLKAALDQKVGQGLLTSYAVSGVKAGDPEELYLYHAIALLANKQRWGSESDLVTSIGAQKGLITVTFDASGNAVAKLVSKTAPADPATFRTNQEATKGLLDKFKLAGIKGEKGRTWKPSELNKVYAAWSRLSTAEAAALEGYTLIRTDELFDDDGKPIQGHTTRSDEAAKGAVTATHTREIRFADLAFAADDRGFIGDAKDAAPASFEVLIHEAGHAIEGKAFDDLNAKAVDEVAKANRGEAIAHQAQLTANRSINVALSAHTEKNWLEAQPLVQALKQAQVALQDLEKNPDAEHEKTAADAIKARDLAHAKIPSKNSVVTKIKSSSAFVKQDEYFTSLKSFVKLTAAALAAKDKANAMKTGANTKRLQAFVDFVNANNIPPLTAYAKKHWPGNPVEFFSEAFSLWKNDPVYFESYSPKLKAWFDAGNHLK